MRVSLLAALSVDGVVAVGEPVKEVCCLIVWYGLGKFIDIGLTDDIRVIFLSVSSSKFQLGSGTNQLTLLFFNLALRYFQ